MSKYNELPNLQLISDAENLSKNATPFKEWIDTRDAGFRARHLIPELPSYGFDWFEEFFKAPGAGRTLTSADARGSVMPPKIRV